MPWREGCESVGKLQATGRNAKKIEVTQKIAESKLLELLRTI